MSMNELKAAFAPKETPRYPSGRQALDNATVESLRDQIADCNSRTILMRDDVVELLRETDELRRMYAEIVIKVNDIQEMVTLVAELQS